MTSARFLTSLTLGLPATGSWGQVQRSASGTPTRTWVCQLWTLARGGEAYLLDVAALGVSIARGRMRRKEEDSPQPYQVGLPSLGQLTRLHIMSGWVGWELGRRIEGVGRVCQ